METTLSPCSKALPEHRLHKAQRMHPRPLSSYALWCVWALPGHQCHRFNWHLLTASQVFWVGGFWVFCLSHNIVRMYKPRMLIQLIMIYHLDKAHCSLVQFVKVTSKPMQVIGVFYQHCVAQHTSLAGFLRHKVPDSWPLSTDCSHFKALTNLQKEGKRCLRC